MILYFFTVAGQVAALFLMMAAGFFIVRLGKIRQETLGEFSWLLMYLILPCLIVTYFQREQDAELLRGLGPGVGLLFLSYLICAVCCGVFFRRQDENAALPLRFGAIYGNTGFMGLPLAAAVLGDGAGLYAMLVYMCFTLFTWTHGAALMGGRGSLSWRKIVLNPGLLGLLAGIPLFLFGIRLPTPLHGAMSYIADLNTPLAMLFLGGQMAFADFGAMLRQKTLYASAAVKLLLVPAMTALVLLPVRNQPLLYCTGVLLSAAPSAGLTAIFARQFNRDTSLAAQSVSFSTLLSLVTLPLWASLARAVTGL